MLTFNTHIYSRTKRFFAAFCLVILVLIGMTASSPLGAQAVIEGYKSDAKLQRGMLVGLSADDPSKVEAVSLDDADRLHGVIVDKNDAAVTIATTDQSTYVAKAGRFEVLVSDQNGPILAGDIITTSAVAGIGMKADPTNRNSLGKALQNFEPGKSTIVSTASLKDSQGNEKNVNIGQLVVELGIGKNPFYEAKEKSALPSWLKQFAETIAGKEVSPLRVYIAIGVFIVSTAITGSLLYSAVRSSIISIGRNPLSKRSILRGLIQVVIVSLIIFISGCVAVYLLLKL